MSRTRSTQHDRLLTSGEFLSVLLSALLYFTATGLLSLALPLYVHDDLGGGAVAVGIAVGAVAFTSILVRPVAGRLSTTRGSKIVALAGLLIVSLSVLCYGLTDSLLVLTLCRMVTGLGQSAAYIGLARIAYDLASDRRKAEATSYFSVSLYGGFALGPMLGNWMIGSLGYSVTWLTAGALGIAAFGIGLFLRDQPVPTGSVVLPQRYSLLQRDSIGPTVVLLLSLSGYAAFATTLPLYVRASLHADPGTAIAVNATIVLLLRLFAGRLPDRLGPVKSATASLILQVTGWIVVTTSASLIGLYCGIAVMSVGVALLYPALFTFAMQRAPLAERGNAVATVTMSFDVANGLGPVLLGAIVAITATDKGAFIAAALLNVAALVTLRLRAKSWTAEIPAPAAAVAPVGAGSRHTP